MINSGFFHGIWGFDFATVGRPRESGLSASVPSGRAKHTVERFTLAPDKVRLRYEITVEDPRYLPRRPR